MTKKTLYFFLIISLNVLFYSCAPTKNSAYLRRYEEIQNLNNPDKVFTAKNSNSEVIKNGDELYITITSGNDEPNSFNQVLSTTTPELLSYKVDNNGNIRLPYLQEVNVSGQTINELIVKIENELSQFIYLPSVSIRKINNRVTILGEVGAPGLYTYNRNTLNIYQAIGFAGDISVFGNRKKVMIVRQENDKVLKKHVDLTNSRIIGTTWYYIQPEDIIYVEPLARRSFGAENFSIFDFFSLITGAFTIYLLFSGI